MQGSDIQFPRIEVLRAETNLLQLDQVPESILLELSHQAKDVVSHLKDFIDQLPEDFSPICSFGELQQNYLGTCDEKCIVYNFLNINFSQKLKTKLTQYCLDQFRNTVERYAGYAIVSADLPKQYDTQYLVYDTENYVDRLSSFAVMSVFAYAQDIENLYDSQLFLRQKQTQILELPKTPTSKSIRDTRNFLKSEPLVLQKGDIYSTTHASNGATPIESHATGDADRRVEAVAQSTGPQESQLKKKQYLLPQQSEPNQTASFVERSGQSSQSHPQVAEHARSAISHASASVSSRTQGIPQPRSRSTPLDRHDELDELCSSYDKLYKSYMKNPVLKLTGDNPVAHYDKGRLIMETQQQIENIKQNMFNKSYASDELQIIRQKQEQSQQRANQLDSEKNVFLENNLGKRLATNPLFRQEDEVPQIQQYIEQHPNSVVQIDKQNQYLLNNNKTDNASNQIINQNYKSIIGGVKSNLRILDQQQPEKAPKQAMAAEHDDLNDQEDTSSSSDAELRNMDSKTQSFIHQIEARHANQTALLKQQFQEQLNEMREEKDRQVNLYREQVARQKQDIEVLSLQAQISQNIAMKTADAQKREKSLVESFMDQNQLSNTGHQMSGSAATARLSSSTILKINELTSENLKLKADISEMEAQLTQLKAKYKVLIERPPQHSPSQKTGPGNDGETVPKSKYNKLIQMISKQQKVIQKQQDQLTQQDNIISRQNERISQMLDTNVASHIATIQDLQLQLISRNKYVQELEQQISRYKLRESQLKDHEKSVHELKQEVEQLKLSEVQIQQQVEKEVNDMINSRLQSLGVVEKRESLNLYED